MNFFYQNSAPAISGNLANYAFRPLPGQIVAMAFVTSQLETLGMIEQPV